MNLTSKQRAYLKGLAMNLTPVQYVGKSSLTDENLRNVAEALAARDLIKLGIQKNCDDDPYLIADAVAERTGASVVQVIGRKIVLYREGKDDKKRIQL